MDFKDTLNQFNTQADMHTATSSVEYVLAYYYQHFINQYCGALSMFALPSRGSYIDSCFEQDYGTSSFSEEQFATLFADKAAYKLVVKQYAKKWRELIKNAVRYWILGFNAQFNLHHVISSDGMTDVDFNLPKDLFDYFENECLGSLEDAE